MIKTVFSKAMHNAVRSGYLRNDYLLYHVYRIKTDHLIYVRMWKEGDGGGGGN